MELYRTIKERAEADLSITIAEINRIQKELEEIAVKRIHAVKTSDSAADFMLKVNAQNFMSLLDSKKENLLSEMVNQEMIAEKKRALVREAMQKVKLLEKLREKKFDEWKEQAEREEENANDDINVSRFNYGS